MLMMISYECLTLNTRPWRSNHLLSSGMIKLIQARKSNCTRHAQGSHNSHAHQPLWRCCCCCLVFDRRPRTLWPATRTAGACSGRRCYCISQPPPPPPPGYVTRTGGTAGEGFLPAALTASRLMHCRRTLRQEGGPSALTYAVHQNVNRTATHLSTCWRPLACFVTNARAVLVLYCTQQQPTTHV
jgi:hypothetical protein